jgi:hypothetical protein
MAEGARVESIDVFKELKLALLKFQEASTTALGDAESEMGRVLMWLQTEQDSYWQHQIRKREEIVTRCKEAVRMKTIFKDATGRQQSAIEEQKALKIAMRNLEDAQQKLVMVRKWARILPKEIEMYKGSVQRFATTVQSELPVAAAHLEKLATKIHAYVSLQSASAAGPVAGESAPAAQPSMGRGGVLAGMPAAELEHLIARAPTPEQRNAAPLVSEVRLAFPTIPSEQHAPAMLPVTARIAPGSDLRICVARSAADQVRVILHHRVERASAQDSGWSIAPLDPAAELEWEAISAADLLRLRPDLADLLGLPAGFSVIIDASGISDVFDARRQPAWRRA